jgi:anti-sigma regulatory factor (Ser/Thr protein kinase)
MSADTGATLALRLRPEPAAPSTARRAVNELSAAARLETRNAVELVVSELVTNSVRHAGLEEEDRIGLRVHTDNRRVRVEVSDPGPGFSEDQPLPSMYQDSGWGLYLVEQIADRWGIQRGRETSVWFEIDHV